MSLAELFLLLSLLPLPILLGVFAAYFQKPWWWAAFAAVVLVMIATIAPTPEAGQPRVGAGDLVFLFVVAFWVAAVAWAGWYVARRLLARGNEGLPRAPRPPGVTVRPRPRGGWAPG